METKRKFLSASGLCQSGYVIVTITRLEDPAWVTITGSVGNDPFVFGAVAQSAAARKALGGLYERHPLSRDEVSEALSDAMARLEVQS